MIWSMLEACGLRARSAPEHTDLSTFIDKEHSDCLTTASGRLFNLLRIDPAQIDIHDIAHHLAIENRYGGASLFPYSVAQHSLICAHECLRRYRNRWDLAFACLLHDGSEFALKDLPRTLKRIVSYCYKPIEANLQNAIWKKYEVVITPGLLEIVKEIDHAALAAEAPVLIVGGDKWNFEGIKPAEQPIVEWRWKDARDRFVRMFSYLDSRRMKQRRIDVAHAIGEPEYKSLAGRRDK